jgi:hypothetical protein
MARKSNATPDEPVTYRIPRPHRTPQPAAPHGMGHVHHAWPNDPAASAPDETVPTASEMAACDVVADPHNGIARVTIAATTQEAVERIKTAAAERGLNAVGAASPSLKRGWVRISRDDTRESPND